MVFQNFIPQQQFGQLGGQQPQHNMQQAVTQQPPAQPSQMQSQVLRQAGPSQMQMSPGLTFQPGTGALPSYRPDPSNPNAPNPLQQQSAPQPSPQMPPQNFMPQQQFGQLGQQQMMPRQNLGQMAAQGGPQGVQNYLSALNKFGASNNNMLMNAPGQHGAGPQAGFQGFQTNGSYQIPQQQFGGVNGGGYNGGGYGQSGNGSNLNANFQQANGSMQGGYGQLAGPQANTGASYGVWNPNQMNNPQYQTSNYDTSSSGNALNTENLGQHWQVNPNQAFSDENLKTNINPASTELQEFLNALGAYKYEYKNPAHGEGEHVSVMAQELEASKLGKQAVINTPEGKMVNYGGRLPAIQLAATAMLNHKINQLESRLTKVLKDKFNGNK